MDLTTVLKTFKVLSKATKVVSSKIMLFEVLSGIYYFV